MKLSAILIFVCTALSAASADSVLLKYDFEGKTRTPVTTDPALLTGGDFTADVPDYNGTFNNPSTGLRRFFYGSYSAPVYGSVVPLLRVQSDRTTLEAAIANNSFFTITLNPQQALNLSLLELNASNGNTNNPFGIAIRSSVTGDTNLENLTLTGGQTNPQLLSINLGSYGEFQNLTSSVTFTFYLYNASNINTQNFIVDNIAFSGSAVPEPSVIALGALGTVGALAWRHRRRVA